MAISKRYKEYGCNQLNRENNEIFVNHTQKRKKCDTVLAVLFPQYHPAIDALMRCKKDGLRYSLINLPLNGTTIVRLN